MKPMMRTQADRAEENQTMMAGGEKDEFPYGLRLHLEGPEMDKLGMPLETGQKVMITAEAVVSSTSQEGSEKGATLQIQSMDVEPADSASPEEKMARMFPSMVVES